MENFGENIDSDGAKKLSLSQEIKSLEKSIQDLKSWMGVDPTPNDRDVLLRLQSELEQLETEREEKRLEIDREFEELFIQISQKGKIIGSMKEHLAEDLINTIKKVVLLNKGVREQSDFVVEAEMITRSEGIRDKVKDLILRGRML